MNNYYVDIDKKLTKGERTKILIELKESYKYYSILQRLIKKIKGEVPNWKNIESYNDEQLLYLRAAKDNKTYLQSINKRNSNKWYLSLLEHEEKLNYAIADEIRRLDSKEKCK